MIKKFHVSTKAQVADIFTKSLGYSSFTRLSGKLGLKDIFVSKKVKESSLMQVIESTTQELRGSVKGKTELKWQ